MTEINEELLVKYGIAIAEEDMDEFMRQFQENLEEHVGENLYANLSDEDAKELANFSGTDDELGTWIQQRVPNYEQIVDEQIDLLLKDVAAAQAEQQQ